jgi:general secretion pathway protein A
VEDGSGPTRFSPSLSMYQSYFDLVEAPFSIAPAPRYLYMSQRHQEALAHLLYGVNGEGGFVLLTGEIGAGKTTICRCLLEQIPEACDVAYVFNPKLTVAELLSTICIEFGITCPPGNESIKVFIDCINAHLLNAHARGRSAVLIIDEAQNLSPEVLEQMRLLTNLETSERKLLQIILIGQPELVKMLERPELRQLAQRIVARYHLGPLTQTEVAAYVRHRLEVAGARRQLFPAALTRRLYRASGGVPRIINVLCDRALLGAYVQGKESVDRKTLRQAEREVLPAPVRRGGRAMLAGMLLLAAGVGLLAAFHWPAIQAGLAQPEARPASAIVSRTPPSPAPLTVLARPDGETAGDSLAIANATLFKAWGSNYAGGDACRQAEREGLRCRNERGSLLELRQFDRPAVLKLLDEQGHGFHVVLLKLKPDTAIVGIGERAVNASLGALARQWTGEYSMLWRAPSVLRETLRPGDSGDGVVWLRQRLAMLDGDVSLAADNHLFDAALSRRIEQFQRERGLNPDGNVGPQTLIHMIGASDPSAPRLVDSPPERPVQGKLSENG